LKEREKKEHLAQRELSWTCYEPLCLIPYICEILHRKLVIIGCLGHDALRHIWVEFFWRLYSDEMTQFFCDLGFMFERKKERAFMPNVLSLKMI